MILRAFCRQVHRANRSMGTRHATDSYLPCNSLAVSRINSQILNEKTTLVNSWLARRNLLLETRAVVVTAYRKMESRRTTTRISTQDSSPLTPMRFDPFHRQGRPLSLSLSTCLLSTASAIYAYIYTHGTTNIACTDTRGRLGVLRKGNRSTTLNDSDDNLLPAPRLLRLPLFIDAKVRLGWGEAARTWLFVG